MDDMNAFERQIAGDADWLMGPEQSFDATEIMRTTTGTAPRWRFRSLFQATTFAVAGVIVALFGGLLLAGLLATHPGQDSMLAPGASAAASPRLSVSIPFRLPEAIPEGVESGAIDTTAGPIRWAHVSGTADTLPSFGDIIPWSTGVAYLEIPRDQPLPARFWVSKDGIEWTLEDGPVDDIQGGSFLDHHIGTSWLGANSRDGATQLWRSADGGSWAEIDLTALSPTSPVADVAARLPGGDAGDLTLEPPVSTGSLTIGVAARDLGMLGDVVEPAHICGKSIEAGAAVYRTWDASGDLCVGPAIRFTQVDSEVQATWDESGNEITSIPGADLSLIRQIPNEDLSERRLFVIDGAVADPVEVPWDRFAPVGLVAAEDYIYAYVDESDPLSGEKQEAVAWRTDDGRSWERLGTLNERVGRPEGPFWRSNTGAWLTTDGATGRQPPTPPSDQRWARRYEPGWFTADSGGDRQSEGDDWSVLIDGAWVSLSELGIEHDRTGAARCAVSSGGVGDVAIFTRADTCYPEDSTTGAIELWLVSLEDIDPAARMLSGLPSTSTPLLSPIDIGGPSPQEEDMELRTPIATALAVGLLASPAAVVTAQDEAFEDMAPMAFTGTIRPVATVSEGTEFVDEDGNTRLQEEVETKRMEVSDPRLSGDVVVTSNQMELVPPAARAARLFSDVYEIDSDGGRWVGTATGFDHEEVPHSVHTIQLQGTDGYDGLAAYIVVDYNAGTVVGAIVPGDMPPLPG